ncbi:MAG: hypothetical protein ACI93T_004042, partial [Porticoccaceae bacterium]
PSMAPSLSREPAVRFEELIFVRLRSDPGSKTLFDASVDRSLSRPMVKLKQHHAA